MDNQMSGRCAAARSGLTSLTTLQPPRSVASIHSHQLSTQGSDDQLAFRPKSGVPQNQNGLNFEQLPDEDGRGERRARGRPLQEIVQ